MTEHVSWSQYSTFSECGKRYYLERIAGAPQQPAVWLLAGTVVHELIERINKGEFNV